MLNEMIQQWNTPKFAKKNRIGIQNIFNITTITEVQETNYCPTLGL